MSDRTLSHSDALIWLKKYCSSDRPATGVTGEMIMRANTPEFKGQFPATLKVEQNGNFVLEVTNVLGGTIAQIKGNSLELQVLSSNKPKYNRSGVTHYMGIPVKILIQLMRGDLPCPLEKEREGARVESNSIGMMNGSQKWMFYRTQSVEASKGELPGKISIEPQHIDLIIEDWDGEQNYARKVAITTEAGTLKWTWRARQTSPSDN